MSSLLMSDFDMSRLPDLLARLDEPIEEEEDDYGERSHLFDSVLQTLNAERAEAAAAIRALMAANRRLGQGMIGALDAVAAEREACAKVCDDRGLSWVAATIRARGSDA